MAIPQKLRKIWPIIFSLVGFVNIFTMIPQTYKMATEKSVSGLSIEMLVIYFIVQITFAFNGKFANDKRQYRLLMIAATFSMIPIILYFIYK